MSFTFANLPGVQVATVDGGLAAVNTPTTKSILVLGTSALGPANSPFQVVSLAAAAKAFGLNGTLVRGMSEVSTYSDNVSLFRIGTSQGSFTVGATASGTQSAGTSVSATWVAGVATYTFASPLPADAVVGNTITTSGFTPAGYNVVAAPILSANSTTGVITTAIVTSLGPGTVQGTGTINVPTAAGITVTLGQVDASANTRYKIWYLAGLLSIWLDSNLVYSNDPTINVNTGDSQVSGTATGGLPVNNAVTLNPDTLANAITLSAASSLTGTAVDLVPAYVAPLTGIGLSGRALYVAQQNAMNLLQGFPVDMVVVPGALADQANVAFYVSATPTSAFNNPVTNADSLDWLWTGVDVAGNPIYQWATETRFYTSDNRVVSTATLQGQSVTTTPITNNFTSATTRLAAGVGSAVLQPSGFHEVSFAYQLARFCAAQSGAPQADNGGCLGFVGTTGPASLSNFSLPSVRTWIGTLPVYNSVTGNASVSGSGLLGISFLVGAAASTLNQACADFANGFRIPGLFTTASGEYDGGAATDANGFKVDIGAYIQVVGDYAIQSNGFGTYVGNVSGVLASLTSSLDEKKAITNKQVAGVSQLYRASLNQLDSLTKANVNVLRFKGPGNLPVALHDETAATAASDYTLALRQRIKFLMVETLLKQAQNFIGNGSNDGLSLTALKTALDADCLTLQKRGYISSYNFTITSTKAQQKIGQASIQVSFVPANELVQLNATVGINLNS